MTRDEALEGRLDNLREDGATPLEQLRGRTAERCANCGLWELEEVTDDPRYTAPKRVCGHYLLPTKAACWCDQWQPMRRPGSVLGEKGSTRG